MRLNVSVSPMAPTGLVNRGVDVAPRGRYDKKKKDKKKKESRSKSKKKDKSKDPEAAVAEDDEDMDPGTERQPLIG